ncbi:MAG: hypothetical protein K0R14_767 [Burkholderiales bacterium]|jgi:hypothetical protein|nr:hypothetical protein [Burkholderiales bacterium]
MKTKNLILKSTLILGLFNVLLASQANALKIASFRMHFCNFTTKELPVHVVNSQPEDPKNIVYSIFRPAIQPDDSFTLDAGSPDTPNCSDNYYGMNFGGGEINPSTEGNDGHLQFNLGNTSPSSIYVTGMRRGNTPKQPATFIIRSKFAAKYDPTNTFIYLSALGTPQLLLSSTPTDDISAQHDDNYCLAVSNVKLTPNQMNKCPVQ